MICTTTSYESSSTMGLPESESGGRTPNEFVETMSLYGIDDQGSCLAEELEKLYASNGIGIEVEQALVNRFTILDPALPFFVLDARAREDLRAFAAKIWVRSLYPAPQEDVFIPIREQTDYRLPVQFADMIVELVVYSPTLVKLGVVAGLDAVADFRLIRRILEIDSDEVLCREAREILDEDGD